MSKPNFFIAGAPKAGTTALSVYLREHPHAFMAKPKEPHYFAEDLPGIRGVTSLSEYLSRFDAATSEHRAIGEASVCYLFSSVALQRIRAFDPDAKIVLMLRNPVELVPSLHGQLLLKVDEDLTELEAAWNARPRRRRGHGIPRTCREPRLLQYGEVCSLGRQLEAALAVFPRRQVHCCLFDDFRADPRTSYERVCRFLGIDCKARPDLRVVNPSSRYRSRAVATLVERPSPLFSKRIAGLKLSPIRKGLRRLNTRAAPRPPLDPTLRRRLADYFRADVRRLEELLDRDLSGWLATS